MKSIYEVNSVSVKPLKGALQKWQIRADGTVTSSGWTRPQLIPRVFVHPPLDGLIEFDFVAEPPSGISLPALMSVVAQIDIPAPDWARGVKIFSATNAVSATPALPAAKATMVTQLFAAHEQARFVDLGLQMEFDPDVSFHDTLVMLENQPITGWKWDGEKEAYMRDYPRFPVNGTLEVFASARSRNQADVPMALKLTISAPGGVTHALTVATKNFKGRAAASYNV